MRYCCILCYAISICGVDSLTRHLELKLGAKDDSSFSVSPTQIERASAASDLESRYAWSDSIEGLVQIDAKTMAGNNDRGQADSNISDQQELPHDYVLIHPVSKLAFCYIPKVACAEMNLLFNDLNGIHNLKNPNPFHKSTPERLGIEWSDITKENGWKFATFVRDPMERYLSAFGSKCLMNPQKGKVEGGGSHCSGNFVDHAAPFDEIVAAFESHAANLAKTKCNADGGIEIQNPHFTRQVDLLKKCGWHKFGPEHVDFVGHLNASVHEQVVTMLGISGVSNASVLADSRFPINASKGHTSATHGGAELFYRNDATVKIVHDMYREDYELLRSKPFA